MKWEFLLIVGLTTIICTTNAIRIQHPKELEPNGEETVQTKYGAVVGLVYPTFRRWQGIPFATPPLGSLRWKKPIPPNPWSNPKDCRYFTIGCAQSGHSMDIPTNKSEDCLYLELWAPRANAYKEPAAVILWFYGGDFKEGGESFQLYDGSYISGNTNTIVIATNYRVGNLGFLYTGVGGTDPNVGIEDQRFSLKWIQDNIAAFGGDPTKVAIAGQSAGGESVLIHLSCPDHPAAQWFTSAIVESGPISLNFKDTDQATVLADVFALNMGCERTDLKCLQAANISKVLEAADKSIVIPIDVSEAIMTWAPVVTGTTDSIPIQSLEAFETGKIVKVPIISGSNHDDGVLFGYAIGNKYLEAGEYIAIVAGIFNDNPDNIVKVLEMYQPHFAQDNRLVLSQMLNDYAFQCSARRSLVLAQTVANLTNTYYYMFSRIPPVCPWPDSQSFCCNFSCHGDEIPYVYSDTGNPFPWNFTGGDLKLAFRMSQYWASMARFGDPNAAGGNPNWPVYREASDLCMVLDLDPIFGPVANYNKEKCDEWDTIGYFHSTRIHSVLANFFASRN